MQDSLLRLLRQIDTPSVCNAIEVAQGRRGFNDFTRGTVCASDDLLSGGGGVKAIVGYARTAKIAAASPPEESVEVIKSRRLAYYKYMSEGVRPAVAVLEDKDYPQAVGAFWGAVNTSLHKGLGVSGTLTNGVMRDLGDLAAGYPVVAGSVGPSHAFVHVCEIGTPVEVFSMMVREGDLVHADRHGGVVIPPEVVADLEAAVYKLIEVEKLIIAPSQEAGFDYEAFAAAWAAFEQART